MMWWEILLVVLAGLILLFSAYFLIVKLRYNTVTKNVANVFRKMFKNANIDMLHSGDIYQMEVQTEKRYLIKLIDINPRYELIITNADRVVINENAKEWRGSSKPHFVSGIRRFMKYEQTDKNIIKIVLIYPNCHNITKYTNESDAFKVKKNQKIDGLYFIKFGNLEEFLRKH
ncbi:hypothetical protein RJI07_02730 [Mycoplasmatota bacterium WC30]